MADTARYDRMKDSGIEWIGDIPKEWKITKTKNVLSNVSERNHPDATVLSLYRDYGIVPKSSRDDNHNVTSEDTSYYKFVEEGNLVINKMKAWQGSLGVSEYEGIVSPAYYVCKFTDSSLCKKYFHYLLRCGMYAQEFERLSTGMRVGQWDLGIDDFMSVPALLPPQEEQTAIASFLDTKCAEIDALIAEIKETIEEYNAWRKSLVFELVTGVGEKSELVSNSSIPWIKKYPARWRILPIKHIVIRRDGGAWGAEKANNANDRVCMRIADFAFEQGRFKNVDPSVFTVRNYNKTQLEKLTLKKGEILIEKSGGGEKTPVGRSILFDLPVDALFSNFMDRLIIDTNIVMPEYFEYYWQAMYFKAVTVAYIKQTTGIQNLNLSNLLESELILIPTIEEQSQIVKTLDSIGAQIDALISQKKQVLDDMEKYKRSLIYEAVTGKRKGV